MKHGLSLSELAKDSSYSKATLSRAASEIVGLSRRVLAGSGKDASMFLDFGDALSLLLTVHISSLVRPDFGLDKALLYRNIRATIGTDPSAFRSKVLRIDHDQREIRIFERAVFDTVEEGTFSSFLTGTMTHILVSQFYDEVAEKFEAERMAV